MKLSIASLYPLLYPTLKELSNKKKNAQIKVRMKKLYSNKLREEDI